MKKLNQVALKDVLMVFLAIVSVLLLFVEFLNNFSSQLILNIDLVIVLIFAGELLYSYSIAKHKGHYLRKYWWEIFACIPLYITAIPFLKEAVILKTIPLIELLRFVRLFARLDILLIISKRYTKQTALVYVMILMGIVILSGAFAFHHFEAGINSHVNGFNDSLYWAAITAATVGYGDIYPVTEGGRIVSVILIFSGIGTIGAFITIIQSYILRGNKK